jgi:N-acetylmuramoyl-L-alanine amidase
MAIAILDNGHGQNTPGKRSPVWSDNTQLYEWAWTREIVQRIKRGLDKLKISSVIIVPESRDILLHERCRRANEIASQFKDAFLVSVHGNAAPQPNQGHGWEVYTSPGETESDRLATCLFVAARQNLSGYPMRADYSDGDPDKEADFTMLTATLCPAALTENLFYDTESECKFMLSEAGRILIAQLHVEGIRNYLKV